MDGSEQMGMRENGQAQGKIDQHEAKQVGVRRNRHVRGKNGVHKVKK
jgi:hypothetical protein